MKNIMKKVSFAFLMVLFAVMAVSFASPSKVCAADETKAYYVQTYNNGNEVKTYKENNKAPKPSSANEEYQDWIFAGWFTDAECTKALKGEVDVDATYYAKYVPAEVLSVKCQVKAGTTGDSTTPSSMRLVSTVDSLNYKRVGFEVYFDGAEKPVVINTTKVYERIVANKDGIDYDFGAKIFDVQADYFVTATLININPAKFNKDFYIRPYWETLDGTVVYGVDRCARVEDSYLNIVNVPVRLYSDMQATSGGFSIAYDANNFSYIGEGYGSSKTPAYTNGNVFGEITVTPSTTAGILNCLGASETASVADGTYVHLRFQMKNPSTAPKYNVFAIEGAAFENDGETVSISVSDVEYTYFFRTDTGNADTSWYDANKDAFVLTSKDEFLGFAAQSQSVNFNGKTVYLGADITVFEGDASTWATTAPGTSWSSIGTTTAGMYFEGTFDGQGHTISGIYSKQANNVGLFKRTGQNSVLKNFRLVNSHFLNTTDEDKDKNVGAITASGCGTFENIYTDAYLTGRGRGVGGFVGGMTIDATSTTIKNCWFDGTISMSSKTSRVGAFVGTCGYTNSSDIRSADITIISSLNTGTINYTSTASATKTVRVGGAAGYLLNQSTLTLKDCLIAGQITGIDGNNYTGALVGEAGANVSVVIAESDKVYTTAEVYQNIIGTGSIDGVVETVAEADTYGFGAYNSVAGLNFQGASASKTNEGTWVGRVGAVPTLKTFGDTGFYYVPDVSWYEEPVRTEKINGADVEVYQISTVQDLYGFASLSYTNNFAGQKIELTKDLIINTGDASTWNYNAPKSVWSPIAYTNGSGTEFAGIFDGCGHSISGIYVKGTQELGLFGRTAETSVIKNLDIENSCIISTNNNANAYVGSLIGFGGGTIEKVSTDAMICASGHGVGGLIGIVRNGYDTSISNCWLKGVIDIAITQDNGQNSMRIGGMIGWIGTTSACDSQVEISHSMYTGKILNAVAQTGSLVGNVRGNTTVLTVNDCFVAGDNQATGTSVGSVAGYLQDTPTVRVLSSVYMLDDACPSSANTLGCVGSKASGATIVNNGHTVAETATYGLNAFRNISELSYYSVIDNTGYWVADVERLPMLKSYVDTYDLYKADTTWHNEPVRTENGKNVYEIHNIEEFYGFAVLSYSNSFANEIIELKTDIVINEGNASEWGEAAPGKRWIPIGYQKGGGTAFAGTFDGQGHTISGVYISEDNNLGFFGKTAGSAVLKNFYLVNSYISSPTSKTGTVHIGAIVGSGSGTFDTIYTDAVVTTSGAGVGGFVGCANLTNRATFTNCWFDGTVNMNGNSHHGGGLIGSVGSVNNGNVSATIDVDNYLFTGKIVFKGTNNYTRVGGLFGATLGSSVVTLKDSLVAGEIDSSKSHSHIASSIGVVGGNTNVSVSEGNDCYVTKSTYTKLFHQVSSGTDYFHEVEDVTTLHGASATTTASSFDFTTYWKTVNGSTPILKCFESDRRWYNSTDTEFVINTVAEFYGFAELALDNNFNGKTVKLGSDLIINEGDAEDWQATAPDRVWYPIGFKSGSGKAFAGTFDGQGHTISGVYVIGGNNLGLFGKVDASATLKNFRLENSYISTTAGKTGNAFVGSIAGSGSGTYEKIYSNAIVRTSGNGVGGFIGCLNVKDTNAKISECWFDGSVENHGTGYHAGGFVGSLGYSSGSDVRTMNLVVADCLFTGDVSFTSSASYARVGGFIGIVLAGSNAKIMDSLSIGTITTVDAEKHHGSIAGFIGDTSSLTVPENGDVYTAKDTYKTVIGYKGKTVTNEETGDYVDNVTGDELIHNLNSQSDFTGLGAYIHGASLDFGTTWMLREGTYPVLSYFASSSDVEYKDMSCFEAEGMEERAQFVDYGSDNYLVTKEDTDKTFYDNYIVSLEGFGFEIVYENAEGLDNGAVYTTICKKENAFFTVTYASKIETTYISVTTNLALSDYLDADYVTNNGGNETNGTVSLSMLELEKPSGSNFIIQLENGHFVVYDSGELEVDRNNMVDYMKALTGNETPIVDAWIVSHVHADHYGVLNQLDADGNGVVEDVYVQGVYINIPSRAIFEKTGDEYSKATSIATATSKLRMSNKTTVPTMYRLQMGQKYYFDGVTMDVMMTQEQVNGYTDLNDSSTWCLFTATASGEKILMGADADKISMQKLMDIYSANYLYADVFAGMHHGVNTWSTFTEYCKTNTICNGKAVDDVVLYSRKQDPTNTFSYSVEEIGDILTAINYVTVNKNLNAAVNKGVNGNKYFYYGQGTIRLTFSNTGIASEIISQ